ncbi:gag/pol protein [Cucumis melo var. makuwa]|uniref:Gag/pol protein n=1 Tax=Cucumis melo var. makuwa TaxID=1194695 RepID=A0A5A7SS84_CUCMM|nr:gag/pol protein [Cucumis melo var. makuwa]
MPQRSGRIVSQPNCFLGLTETQLVIPDDGVEDPLSSKQAMNDVDKDKSVKAMDLEMESMYFNSVWELVDLPEGPEGFITQGQKKKVCKLNRSIYELKQASRSWNIRFDTVIKSYGFDQNVDEPCVYKKINKAQFQMKDLGEAHYNSKMNLLPFRHVVHLSKEQCPKIPQEVEDMRCISYALVVGSLMYSMLCIMSDICYAVGIRSIKQGCIADSTMEAENIAACKTAKEAV